MATRQVQTTLLNPYVFATAGLLPRLAQRLLEGEPSVWRLLAPEAAAVREAAGGAVHAIAVRREWVRFSTLDELLTTGAWWVEAPAEQPTAGAEVWYREAALACDPADRPTRVPPWTELELDTMGGGNYWAERRAAAAKATADKARAN